MKLNIKKDATSQAVYLFIQDSSVTTGAGKTGLVFNTASLVAYYVRPLGTATAITLATQTVTGAYSSGGFVEVDATNMPGIYRLDLPNAVLATGVNSVVVMLKGAANMAPVTLEIQLVSYDPNDAAALGLSLVPANVTQLNGVAQSLLDLKDFADDGYDPTTNKVTGVLLVDTITTYTGNTPQTGDCFTRLGAPTGASVSADIAGVQSDTNDIQTRLPAALVVGKMDCSVGAMAAGVLTATAIATGAIDADALAADVVTDIWMGTALTEAYAADGAAATPAQLLYQIFSAIMEISITGTTMTCKKLDGMTTAMTVTLDSATNPTSRTRAT